MEELRVVGCGDDGDEWEVDLYDMNEFFAGGVAACEVTEDDTRTDLELLL